MPLLCSSPAAAEQPHESRFTTEILLLGVISSERDRGSILELQIRQSDDQASAWFL